MVQQPGKEIFFINSQKFGAKYYCKKNKWRRLLRKKMSVSRGKLSTEIYTGKSEEKITRNLSIFKKLKNAPRRNKSKVNCQESEEMIQKKEKDLNRKKIENK